MLNFSFFKKTAPAAQVETEQVEAPAQPTIIRQDFDFNFDGMTTLEALQYLRNHTVDFVEDNRLTWGCTDSCINGVPVRVKLSKNWNITYRIGGLHTRNQREAAQMIESATIAF